MGDPETHRSKKKSKTWAWREIVELRERKRKKEREMEVYGSCAVKGKEVSDKGGERGKDKSEEDTRQHKP